MGVSPLLSEGCLGSHGGLLLGASFGMVTLSVSGFATVGILGQGAALEVENAALRETLDRERSARRKEREEVAANLYSTISAAKASEARAVARAEEAERARGDLARALDQARAARARAESEARAADARADSESARAAAATALADAAEAYALELDLRLSRAEQQRDVYKHAGEELRTLASRHLPDVAPVEAEVSLEQLRQDLERAKATEGAMRDYLVGLACSGLRTFEAGAAGYSDVLGRRLLEEARALRLDPACLAFDGEPAVPEQAPRPYARGPVAPSSPQEAGLP